jgi:large subunit ribosomal protein L21
MYAVIKTGGKQYRVAANDVIKVEKLAGEAGSTIELDQVLMLGEGADTTVGAPLIEGAKVVATVLEQTRADKILVFKKKRRKKYRRTKGHRQDITVLRITDVLAAGAQAAKPKAAAAATPKAAPKPEAKAEDAAADAAPEKKTAAKKAVPKKAAPKKPAAKKASAKKPAAKKSTEENS